MYIQRLTMGSQVAATIKTKVRKFFLQKSGDAGDPV